MASTVSDDTAEFCAFCGRTGKTLDCNCLRARRLAARFAKPLTRSVVVTKSYGRCPICGAVIGPQNVLHDLKVMCHGCGNLETYENIKKGVWAAAVKVDINPRDENTVWEEKQQ